MTDPALPFELGVVSLDNRAFEGNNNSYLLGTEAGATTTLVDTGVAVPETRDQLRAGLQRHGLGFADVEQVLLTHHHADHTGLAGEIQAASGCPVYVHSADAPLIAQEPAAMEAAEDRLRDCIEAWGMPQDKQEELVAFLESTSGIDGDPPDVTSFEDGATLDVGPVELEAVHMPGHAAGLAGFAVPGRDGEELFSGDALLPYYTPNVGGADTRVDDALAKYLVVEVLADGPATPWAVSAELFGSLSAIHILHGPGEAFAHLEHLRDAGLVAREGRAFELLEADPDLAPLFPDLPVTAAAHPDP
ncbi:MBL fold metallo-hydrolase [Halobacteriales archaeon QS_1_68_44]|nr:MAG: MBL fold metallo-hydrolase [Halobacteriales archaeon QS_1_68_44]